MIVETVLTPADLPSLSRRDLTHTTCVVIDVLRATSSMITAFAHGALEVLPVAEIPEALAMKERIPDALLAGERHGVRIRRQQTGSIDFDLGNSPRDFTRANVEGRSIIWTTTNGTRALRACACSARVMLGALMNLDALADQLQRLAPGHLMLVCAGTFDAAAFEDIFTAGALIDALRRRDSPLECSDSSQVAWRSFLDIAEDREALVQASSNARRLLATPDLAPDVEICFRRNSVGLNAEMNTEGAIRVCF